MLTNVLRVLVNNPFLRNYRKKINILTVFFFIFHKNDIKMLFKMNY